MILKFELNHILRYSIASLEGLQMKQQTPQRFHRLLLHQSIPQECQDRMARQRQALVYIREIVILQRVKGPAAARLWIVTVPQQGQMLPGATASSALKQWTPSVEMQPGLKRAVVAMNHLRRQILKVHIRQGTRNGFQNVLTTTRKILCQWIKLVPNKLQQRLVMKPLPPIRG